MGSGIRCSRNWKLPWTVENGSYSVTRVYQNAKGPSKKRSAENACQMRLRRATGGTRRATRRDQGGIRKRRSRDLAFWDCRCGRAVFASRSHPANAPCSDCRGPDPPTPQESNHPALHGRAHNRRKKRSQQERASKQRSQRASAGLIEASSASDATGPNLKSRRAGDTGAGFFHFCRSGGDGTMSFQSLGSPRSSPASTFRRIACVLQFSQLLSR